MLSTNEQNKLAEKEWEEIFKEHNITDELAEKYDLRYLDEDESEEKEQPKMKK